MPYQGPDSYRPYIPPPPPPVFDHHGSRGYTMPGQAPPYHPGNGQAQIQQQQQQQQQQNVWPYQAAPDQHTSSFHGVSQFYDNSQSASFYQSPVQPSSLNPHSGGQQQYLSPPTQANHFPPSTGYSPDLLQQYQAPAPSHQQYHARPSQCLSQTFSPHEPYAQLGWAQSQSPEVPTSSSIYGPSTVNDTQLSAVQQHSRTPVFQQASRQSSNVSASPAPRPPNAQIQRAPTFDHRPSSTIAPLSLHSSAVAASGTDYTASELKPRKQPSVHLHDRPQNRVGVAQAPRHDIQARDNATDMTKRRIAHVEVPVQRVKVKSEEPQKAPLLKSRKSVDGHPVPVCGSKPDVQQRFGSSKTEFRPSAPKHVSSQAQDASKPTPIDYQAVLLALSDEYINAAYSMSGALASADVSDECLAEYHGLLATGMGCLESVIRNCHISDARKEARIRLRLASLLYEETDNDMEAEELLAKGISMCERARLLDLKYAMQHLLARLWYKSKKFKAAMKAVDKLIVEVDKLSLLHWVYTFRFLRVSFGIQIDISHAETTALIKNLNAINEAAATHRHVSVQIVASALEALVQLRFRTPESVDLAQRAVAAARTHQLSSEMASMPQARALVDFVDLACSLSQFNAEQAATKMEAMQTNLDASIRDLAWTKGGYWSVPLCKAPNSHQNVEADTGGLLQNTGSGAYALCFMWLTGTQAYSLGFLLSGLANIHKNASSEQKAESFLNQGVKLSNVAIESVPQSVSAASAQYRQQRMTRMLSRIYVVFAYCGRANWEVALKGIRNVAKDIADLEIEPAADIFGLITYLEAMCKHGLGDLDGALELYRSRHLQLEAEGESKNISLAAHPIKVLAVLNTVLIIRSKEHGLAAERLLKSVQEYCLVNPNSNGNESGSKALESAFFVLKATEPPDITVEQGVIIKTKQYLQSAVQAAKSAVNNQLLCIVMNLMTDMFFNNIVGEQAQASARAGRSLARKSQDKLWTAVADRMYGNTLEKCGKADEAATIRQEAQDVMARLPESLLQALCPDDMDTS